MTSAGSCPASGPRSRPVYGARSEPKRPSWRRQATALPPSPRDTVIGCASSHPPSLSFKQLDLPQVDASVAVTQNFLIDTDGLEHGQQQVRQRRVLRIANMTPALPLARRAADNDR